MLRILGAFFFLWGLADLILFRLEGIDIYAVMGIRVPELIFPFTNIIACAIGVGLTTIHYQFAPKDAYYDAVIGTSGETEIPAEKPPVKQSFLRILSAFLWGGAASIICLIAVYHIAPGAFLSSPQGSGIGNKTITFVTEAQPWKGPPFLGLIALIVWTVLLFIGSYLLRLRGFLSGIVMLFGAASVSFVFAVSVVKYPRFGSAVYSEKYVNQLHSRMGYPGGLPAGWMPWHNQSRSNLQDLR
ncbi:hypothetical protein [Parasulfitobacter algicola]|uniref:Transmembrane protein n=1 Tax=Parasulfitobacter algicola TaxID=2614809 RepID=A0ABX2IZK6_9RHOB|nr:hypothetical protein [Sulfitobacter algicola]NSX56707.1 hypothetical protein [Sulfitobacter algicola]